MYNIFATFGGETFHVAIRGEVAASNAIDALLDAGFDVESDMWDAYCGRYY